MIESISQYDRNETVDNVSFIRYKSQKEALTAEKFLIIITKKCDWISVKKAALDLKILDWKINNNWNHS